MRNRNAPKMGCLYGIGVGPGDPELLTLKAARVIREVPVVVVPKNGESGRSYALSIVHGLLCLEKQEILELVFPMRKDPVELEVYWQKAADAIRTRLEDGKDCAFLTEGDSLFYGTFIYVMSIFRERFPDTRIEVIPGITSMNASSARTMVPLANGEDKMLVIPATYDPEYIASALREFDTIVLLKIASVFDRVLEILEGQNLVEKTVFVKRCTAPEEEIIFNIRELQGQKLDYLSLLIVRK